MGKMVNKLVYRMPVMIGLRMAARKYIDSDDEQTTLYIRVAYGLIQFFMLCTAFFLYSKARTYNQTNKEASKTIYIPIKPGILADEETKSKKKYKETTYGEHILSTIISDIKSMLFRICFTSALHIFRGVVIGLLIQSFMGPLGLFDSPLVKVKYLRRRRRVNWKVMLKLLMGMVMLLKLRKISVFVCMHVSHTSSLFSAVGIKSGIFACRNIISLTLIFYARKQNNSLYCYIN